MKLTFLGGACEVGASCILLSTADKNILLDCGIRQKANVDVLPDFRTLQHMGGVDTIVVSHAHMDHTGALPIISKEYPNARIYMNNMTKDLIKVLLKDSLKIMGSRESEIPLYAENDVEGMLDRIFTVNYGTETEIAEGIRITFYNAGHIAGASCAYLTTAEGALFYSGDFSIFSQKSVEGAKIPKLRPDAAIFESTYGDRLHSNREVEEERLINLVKQCVSIGGKMLIPSFALGRAQEILLILKKAMNNKKLKSTKIYVDGMIKDINRVYKLNPLYLKSNLGRKIIKGMEPFYDDNISFIENNVEREKVISNKESAVIVASSGMLSGGPSQYYAEKIASMENGFIVITGYQDEEAPGRKLLELLEKNEEERVLEINKKIVPVKCKVERVGLSAHGDKSEIKALVNLLSPRNIFLVHGEETVVQKLAGEISSESRGRVYAPGCGETIDLEIHNPRKQFKRELKLLMNVSKSDVGADANGNVGGHHADAVNGYDSADNVKSNPVEEIINESGMAMLWKFVHENYGDRFFTVEELFQIWKGGRMPDTEELQEFQSIIVKSLYFENDLRRFFMFKAKSKVDLEEELKPKELKQNELDALVGENFGKYKYKKSGFILNEKKIILYFDFPKALDNKIFDELQAFYERYLWKIEINEQINTTAVDNIIRILMRETTIKKISYFLNEGKVSININTWNAENTDFSGEKLEFKKITGLDMIILNEAEKASLATSMKNEGLIRAEENADKMEQNAAFAYIDSCFGEEASKPYRKSIKTNGDGKYIEVSFISPKVGSRYKAKLQTISRDTGWSIAISNSVNQNEIINLAVRLCMEAGFELKKNPSFNPGNLKVVLKLDNFDENKFLKIKEDFDFRTGCSLSI